MTTELATSLEQLALISRRTFAGLDADHRTGDPDHGTAQVGRETVDGGIVFVPVRVVDAYPLFLPGQTVMTTNIERYFESAGLDPIAVYTGLLDRHLGGDWGRTYVEDLHQNDEALRDGNRLFSVYEVAGETCWLISDFSENPRVRVTTTLLLPEDY